MIMFEIMAGVVFGVLGLLVVYSFFTLDGNSTRENLAVCELCGKTFERKWKLKKRSICEPCFFGKMPPEEMNQPSVFLKNVRR